MVDGVPGERTALAWQRTGWTACAAGALVLHAAPAGPGAVAGGVLLAAGVLCVVVMAPTRLRSVAAALADERPVAAPGVTTVVTATVVLVGVLAAGALLYR